LLTVIGFANEDITSVEDFDQFRFTFTYTLNPTDIDLDDDLAGAVMTLTPIGPGTSAFDTNIKTQFDNLPHTTIPILAGIYSVKFTLTVGGDTVVFMHVVHIYKDLDSSYEFTIGMNYFNAIYKFKTGDLIFDGGEKNPEIEYSIDGGTAVDYVEKTIISLTRGKVIVFTIKNEDEYNSFEWYCLTATSLGSTDTCTIDTSPANLATDPYNQFSSLRNYTLTVIGESKEDGKKYATIVQFSVNK
jgi:hypothetical protein